MFQYISFRAAAAIVISLFISMVVGKRLIRALARKQIGETVRDLGLAGQKEKEGTPTMGGLIIIAAILIPVLLLCRLDNIYVLLMILTTVWLGTMGFNIFLNTSLLMPISLLRVGVRQIAIILAIGVGVAFAATFIPCYRNSCKKPIDVIKDL